MRILVVEDDAVIRSTLSEILTTQHYQVSLAADGQIGLSLAEQGEYDLIVLDVVVPGLDGISLCKQLRSQGYTNPILLLTAKDSATDRVLGLDAGADDYMVKPFDTEELLARIRALLRRGKGITDSAIVWENLRFDPISGEVSSGDKILHLTPKEYCLLELFLLNPKRIFSRRAILDRLWDFAESPAEETVSTHIKCLRQKLKVAGVADPIETVHGLGYRLRPPTSSPSPLPLFPPTSLIPHPSSPPPPPSTPTASPLAHQPDPDYRQKVAAHTAKVWHKSRDRFIAQVGVLQQAAIALSSDSLTPELRQQAKQEAHKLAGSLGIFGRMAGSSIARELEDLLQPHILLDVTQAPQIADLVQQLRRQIDGDYPVAPPTESVFHTPLLLIVDDDLLLADRIRIEAIAWGLRVELATDLSVARKAIAQSPPDVILLDLNFPGAEDGFSLLQELMQRVPPIPVLTFTGRGELGNRLAVARLGGGVFLQKPLPAYEILKAITDALHRSRVHHYNRVLVVDDDATVVESLSALLHPLSIDVTGLSNPQEFWEKLTAIVPNLLVLDLEMPGIDGVELCQAVRSDPNWQQLPVLFLSTHTDSSHQERAFTAGADDYISKSTPSAELATRIMHRLRRGGFGGGEGGTGGRGNEGTGG
jgi:DNA-binding response OmpR family regulator